MPAGSGADIVPGADDGEQDRGRHHQQQPVARGRRHGDEQQGEPEREEGAAQHGDAAALRRRHAMARARIRPRQRIAHQQRAQRDAEPGRDGCGGDDDQERGESSFQGGGTIVEPREP